jgi:hypothetical protein
LSRTLLVCISLWVAVASAYVASGAPAEQPAIEVRLKTHLTSYASRRGSPFECVVIRPFEVNGQLVIPQGTTIRGTVRRAMPVGLGLFRERAGLELNFEEYQTPDGHRFALNARLASIDNSREEVTSKGRIKGVVGAGNPNQFIFGLWLRPSLSVFYRSLIGLTGASNQLWAKFSLGPLGAVALLGLRCAIFPFPEPEIHLPPGTDMKLLLTTPLSTTIAETSTPPAGEPSNAVSEWIQREPYSTEKRNGRIAGDIVNVAFIGSKEQLQEAFSVSGWSLADPDTIRNVSRMYGAFNAMRDYAGAPVSALLYQGADPELVFEKSLDTIAKRHHVRIWRAGVLDGEDVWLGAATHDTGIAFSVRSVRFTHRIDTNIDSERTKISTDLSFAGCSQPATRVERSDVASASRDRAVSTDGAVAVLELQPCAHRSDLSGSPAPKPPGNKFSRLTRRVVLEARNYILRENVYYWGYQLIRRERADHAAAPN